jgi:hypothetical protein
MCVNVPRSCALRGARGHGAVARTELDPGDSSSCDGQVFDVHRGDFPDSSAVCDLGAPQ